jgi:hypothetical protein
MVSEFEDETIRELMKGNYRIVYQVIDDFRIDVLMVNNFARLIKNNSAFFEDL